jgi:hypothetical protein
MIDFIFKIYAVKYYMHFLLNQSIALHYLRRICFSVMKKCRMIIILKRGSYILVPSSPVDKQQYFFELYEIDKAGMLF